MIACNLQKNQLLACLCFCLTLSRLAAITKCQSEADLEDQFQDFHHDLGRISGGAPHTASIPTPAVQTPAPIVRITQQKPTQQQHHNHHQHESHDQGQSGVLQPTRRASVARSQNQAQPVKPARNRVTLAVRQQAAEPKLEGVTTPVHVRSQQQQHHQITQPIVAPLQTLAQQEQYSALMARVAAERREHDHVVADSAAREDFSASPAARSREVDQSQVVAPPAAPPTFSTLLEPAQLQQPQLQRDHLAASSFSAPAQAQAAASVSPAFGDHPEEQIEAPTLQQVLSNGCPRKGVFSWDNKDHCDRYYVCTNGTFTEEACPNGLAYSQMGAVYQHCAYQWNVDCGLKKSPGPLASPGCPWQFGIFPTSAAAQCSIDYFVCEWGVPEKKRCQPEGLFYDERIKGCQWADQLGCKSEALLNFKCPPEDEDNPFWPFPRYYHTKQDVIVCVNEQPRLVHCTEEQVVEPSSLSCIDLKKKKKKNF